MSFENEKHEKSQITGSFVNNASNTVQYQFLESGWRRFGTIMVAAYAVLITAAYVAVLIFSAIRAITEGTQQFATLVAVLALGNELVKTPLTLTLAYASTLAKKPLPVLQEQSMDVLLGITFVPKSEDINRLKTAIIAAMQMKHDNGKLAICVFDEGSDAEPNAVFNMVNELNEQHQGHEVFRVSRQHIPMYRTKENGKFKEKTKYGNINAGLAMIKNEPEYYGTYDVLMGLDPDHVGTVDFVERMLGPFTNPDVAFVAGPQSYENATDNLVARWAESNQFVFHALVQSVANVHGAAMLVGTSYAIRFSVLEQIGGIQPSITEDLATTFAVLSRKNPITNNPWNSVYTPDLLAHGEGPSTWGDFFKQQDRWSRGAMEFMWAGPFFKQMLGMWRKPWRIVHYTMLMSFYPIMAISWLLAAANSALVAVAGASGRILDPDVWFIFYGWATLGQMWLYFRMRRHNVSPFERRGSWGFFGMFMGVVTAPIFADALLKTIFRRPVGFNVTPKGTNANKDVWYTFRLNIRWIVFYAALIVVGYLNHHLSISTLLWSVLAILLLTSPMAIWKVIELEQPDAPQDEDFSSNKVSEATISLPIRSPETLD